MRNSFERAMKPEQNGKVYNTNGSRDYSWPTAANPVREQIHYHHESPDLSERQRDATFLRRLMLYDQTDACRLLADNLDRAERSERCVRRAVWLMALLTAAAVIGLGYTLVLLKDFPTNQSHFVVRIICAFGVASLISLLVFVGCWLISCGKVNELRDKCRSVVTRILVARLGPPDSPMQDLGGRRTAPGELETSVIPESAEDRAAPSRRCGKAG